MKETLIVHGWLNKLRAKAAAILVSKNIDRFSRIVFSWGKTAGQQNPSEAENMQQIFIARIKLLVPNLDIDELNTRIFLEKSSCDTEANASEVKSKLWTDETDSTFTLLSSLSHLPRVYSIYKRIWFSQIKTVSAEWIFYKTWKEQYRKYFRRYMASKNAIRASILEIPLFFLTQFEWWRKWIRSKTQSRIQSKNPPSE